MEAIHDPESRNHIGEEISNANILREWRELQVFETETSAADLPKAMNVNKAIVDELEAVCSVDNLKCENEPSQFHLSKLTNGKIVSAIPKKHQLATLKFKKKVNEKRDDNASFRQYLAAVNKYKYFESKMLVEKKKTAHTFTLPIKQPELVLTVNLYQPYKKEPGIKHTPDLKIEQQFLVLGSQKLTELRDRFICAADAAVLEDLSEAPRYTIAHTRAKDIYTSGFFYINGTIYNDMRLPQSRDNSKVIREWAETYPDMEIGPFETKLMEETQFVDLTLKLGYPYVYQHQGNCEHLLVFQDVRLINADDCQDYKEYPVIRMVGKRKRVTCMVCHIMTARWVTLGNQRLAQDPFFFCESCFWSYNYTADEKKIGQFRAYPYIDRSALI